MMIFFIPLWYSNRRQMTPATIFLNILDKIAEVGSLDSECYWILVRVSRYWWMLVSAHEYFECNWVLGHVSFYVSKIVVLGPILIPPENRVRLKHIHSFCRKDIKLKTLSTTAQLFQLIQVILFSIWERSQPCLSFDSLVLHSSSTHWHTLIIHNPWIL